MAGRVWKITKNELFDVSDEKTASKEDDLAKNAERLDKSDEITDKTDEILDKNDGSHENDVIDDRGDKMDDDADLDNLIREELWYFSKDNIYTIQFFKYVL